MNKKRLYPLFIILIAGILSPYSGLAEVFYAKDEALKIAFPEGAEISQRTFILTPEEKSEGELKAKAKIESNLFTFFEGKVGGAVVGYAAIDSRIVRTMIATYLVVLTPEGKVTRVVILAFHEPPEYLPLDNWLRYLEKDVGIADLEPNGDIPPIAGSTLTVEAMTAGVRTVRALFELLILKR